MRNEGERQGGYPSFGSATIPHVGWGKGGITDKIEKTEQVVLLEDDRTSRASVNYQLEFVFWVFTLKERTMTVPSRYEIFDRVDFVPYNQRFVLSEPRRAQSTRFTEPAGRRRLVAGAIDIRCPSPRSRDPPALPPPFSLKNSPQRAPHKHPRTHAYCVSRFWELESGIKSPPLRQASIDA